MSCRRLTVVLVLWALAAVRAARQGAQPAAALMPTQTGGRECSDFEGTMSDEEELKQHGVKKKWYHMGKRCFCPKWMSPSEGCGKVGQVKDVHGDLWHSFRLGAADSSCKCFDPCDDFWGAEFDEDLKKYGVKRSQGECFCRSGMSPSKSCGTVQQVKDVNGDLWPSFRLRAADSSCRCFWSQCQDIKDTAKDWEVKEWSVKRSQGECFCDANLFPSKHCGGLVEEIPDAWLQKRVFRSFNLSKAGPGCECLQGFGKSRERSELVSAAAVRFCAAILEETSENSVEGVHFQKLFIKDKLKVTPEVCQEVLTGTLEDFGTAENKRYFGEAEELSKHQGTRGWGHLDPLVIEALPSSAEYHIKLLKHVCHDECENIVEETIKHIKEMTKDVESEATPFEQLCADKVVRKVEAEILGCCARSCGYNGKSCLSWPFFAKAEKVLWLKECCSEWNVLSGSPREAMRASVLTPGQARKVAAFDVKVKEGTDMGEPYIGQGPLLRWTKEGVKSWLGKKYSQSRHPPVANGPVLSQVMEEHPDIRAEGLKKNWFKEKNITDMADMGSERGAASFVEASGEQCDVRDMTQCTATFQDLKVRSCLEQKKWRVSPKVQEKKKDEYEDGCPKGNPQPVETPEKCLTAFQNSSDVKSFFFEFHNEDDKPLNEDSPARPIKCYVETKGAPCDAGFPKVKQSIQDIASEDLQLEQLTFWLAAEDL